MCAREACKGKARAESADRPVRVIGYAQTLTGNAGAGGFGMFAQRFGTRIAEEGATHGGFERRGIPDRPRSRM